VIIPSIPPAWAAAWRKLRSTARRFPRRRLEMSKQEERRVKLAMMCDDRGIRVVCHTVNAHWMHAGAGYGEMLDGRCCKPALIGGAIPQRAVLSALRTQGYQDHINIEYESRTYDAYEGIRQAADYLRGLAA